MSFKRRSLTDRRERNKKSFSDRKEKYKEHQQRKHEKIKLDYEKTKLALYRRHQEQQDIDVNKQSKRFSLVPRSDPEKVE